MNSDKSNNIKRAIRAVALAKERLNTTVAHAFPLGADVRWNRGGHWQYGKVINHGSPHGRCGRLRIENDATGSKYWIGMYDVIGYVET